MEKIRAIIIDDEDHCRSTLKKQVEWFAPSVNILGDATGVQEGIKMIERHKPDLVFLDIEMNDGSGFDLVRHFSIPDFKIIFTTAFDEYALEAFKVHALAYLLKPIDGEELSYAIRNLQTETKDQLQKKLEAVMLQLSSQNKISKVALPVLDGLVFVHLNNIVRIEASGNYCTVYLNNGKNHFISKTLKYFTDQIQDQRFIRVHQSHLVNMDYVYKYIRGKNGQIILEDGAVVPVSRSKKEDFLDNI